MATIHDLEIFRVGKHNAEAFPPERVARILENSNACLPYILASIQSGKYEGNPHIDTQTKPIPGLINFAHQRYLRETLRDAVKDISIEFKRRGEWIVATVKNLKSDLAEFIKERFPYRSIELIPELNVNGQMFTDVIRSIAFLPPDIAPAVSGQSPHFAVEYSAHEGFIQLFSKIEIQEEDKLMAEEKTKQEQTPIVSVDEFAELKAKVAEMQAKAAQDEKEKAELQTRLQTETTKREQNEIAMFCKGLQTDFGASPAFLGMVKPLLERADNHAIIEFAEGRKSPMREELQRVLTDILKNKDSLTVPIGEYAAQTHADPSKQKASAEESTQAKIQEFMEIAKGEAKNPNDKNEVFLIASGLAAKKYGDALTKGGK
jgi:hypothetical protein